MDARSCLSIASALLCALLPLVSPAARAQAQTNLTLVGELQKGGYVIFIRHGATDPAQKDVDPNNLDNCATQRNLIDHGRRQAEMIGAGFRALQIPVGTVLSSGYCRCMETAKIAFGRAQAVESLGSYMPVSAEEKARRVAYLAQWLNTPPASGTNTTIIGHHYMFEDVTGVKLEEGEGAIYKPGAHGPQFVARIRAEGWRQVIDQFQAATTH